MHVLCSMYSCYYTLNKINQSINQSLRTFGALAGVAVGSVTAACSVLTGRAGALVHVVLAHGPGEP